MALPDGLRQRLAQRLGDAQRDARLPSLSAAVWRRGEPRAEFAFSAGAPELGPETQYRMGSITKTFTAALVLQLRDEGALGLHDPLDAHVPGTPVGDVTIRDLLGHLSGLRQEPGAPFWEASEGLSADELLSGLGADHVVLPPRRAFHYSNLGYALLGQVVERRRGVPYEVVVRQHVLEPLGLANTTYLPREPYQRGLRAHPFSDVVRDEPMTDTRAMAPAGQLWSTPDDLCCWGLFLADPVEEVLAPATVEEMFEPVALTDLESWTAAYGLGVQLFRRGDRILGGHGGSMPGFVAGLVVDRRSGVVAAVCANAWQALRGTDLAADLVMTVLEDEPAEPPMWVPTRAPEGLEELLGTWWWRGVAFVVWVADGTLHLGVAEEPRGANASRFEPDGPDGYVCTSGSDRGERLAVLRDNDGRVRALDVGTGIFTRDLDDPAGDP